MRMSQCGDHRFYDYEDDYEVEEDYRSSYFSCDHIAIVSLSATETQCIDCLRIWPKEENFRSDYPEMDRG